MNNLRKKNNLGQTLKISPSRRSFTRPLRLRSEMYDQQIPETYFQETYNLLKPNISSNITLHERNNNRLRSFQLEEFDKIMVQNRLTLDFDENAKNTDIPAFSTFKNTEKLLVSPPAFEQFKQANIVDGRFRSALSQAEQEFNIKNMKINISKNSQIIVRQNRINFGRGLAQLNSENDIKSILSKSRKNGFSLCIGAASKLRNNMKSLRKISYKLGKKGNENMDKWKLKDFYDPILEELQSDELILKRIRQRQEILYKLKKINSECSQMENNTHTSESIEVFAKYSQKMSDKLVKKQKKIDKIYFSHY